MKYRTIFFGTPEFSVPFLKALIKDASFDVIGVITSDDKKAGRGQKLKQSAVTDYWNKLQNSNSKLQINLKSQIPIYKTDKIKNLKLKIKNLRPDMAVLVAYGNIIPNEMIDLFPKGIINIHPSLLPKYRGPDPLRAAILAGDDKTGISIMMLDDKMDHGLIINQTEINISENDDLGDLYEKVIKIGPDFLIKSLQLYLEDKLKPKPQDHSQATFTKMVKKSDAQIDWNNSIIEINRHIKAFNPIPGAYTYFDQKLLKILQSHLKNDKIVIDRVKPEGKREMDWQEFLNGYRGQIPPNIVDKLNSP